MDPLSTVALISGGISFVSGLFGASAAKKAERKAAAEKAKAQRTLDRLVADRQDVINPFEDVKDLSSMLSNPMANLSVATQAAEMQVEEADISLANTLDTVRATGASAGGATALAQAALQSKKGVSASIEQQEVANQQNAAAAQGQIDQAKMGEQQRLQNVNMSEAQRMQNAEAQGADYVFKATETRQIAGLDRAQTQVENAQGVVAQHQKNRDSAVGSAIGQIGGVASAVGGLINEGAAAKAAAKAEAQRVADIAAKAVSLGGLR